MPALRRPAPSTRFLPLLVLALLLLSGSFIRPACAAPVEQPSELTLTLLHTNDLHGHLLPFAYTEKGRSPDERPSVGGAARRATLIRRLRSGIANPVMVIDAGDTFTRGPLTNAYEGIADTEAMNAIGYELAAIGNNEFKAKDGVEASDAAGAQAALLQVVKRSRFPWICANVTDERGAFLEGVQPYVVREFHGVRVGFLGLTAPRSAQYPQTKGWKFIDPVEAAREWIPKVRRHCDILVAVTHLGTELDKTLVSQTAGIDAVVGGDSHTFLYKAVEVANTAGIPVPIVQTGEFGVNLGQFDLHLTRGPESRWRLARYDYLLHPVGPDLAEAPDVVAAIVPYVRPMQARVGKIAAVGATPEERSRNTTQLVADALRRSTGADYALNPLGGGFFEVFRRADVTRYDVFAVMPFKNRIVTAERTGAEIRALLPNPAAAAVSGSLDSAEPTRKYRVAFVDFIAHSVYKIPEDRLQETGTDIREAVIAYLGEQKAGVAPSGTRSTYAVVRRSEAPTAVVESR